MIEVIPDIKFKKQLTELSKAPLNECMQCGTCSVVCSLAPEDKPFPRKEMVWAGWGLRERLLANADVWLCHQCGDCSKYCPRGVRPADVLSAIRQMTYREYARPRFMGRILASPKWLPVATLIPVIIISSILMLAGTFTIPEGPVNYSKFFPHAWLNASFSIITLISYGLAVTGLNKFLKDIQFWYPELKLKGGLLKHMFSVLGSVMTHTKFAGCTANKSRRWAHMLVFYGFILLLAVTVYAILATLTHRYPLSIVNPFKIMGNLAALMLFAGLIIMIINRLFNKNLAGRTGYSDWLLLVSLFLLTLSGVVVELARFQNWDLAYHLYFGHLVCVWFVIIYLPYTKFGHTFYRLAALGLAHAADRK